MNYTWYTSIISEALHMGLMWHFLGKLIGWQYIKRRSRKRGKIIKALFWKSRCEAIKSEQNGKKCQLKRKRWKKD